MSSAVLNTLSTEDDVESQRLLGREDDVQAKKDRRSTILAACGNCICNMLTSNTVNRAVHYFALLFSLILVSIFIYASFSV